jgi:hypothetical protein
MSRTEGAFVAKRFLRAADGSAVNADHVVRIYTTPADGKLWADMSSGADIELYSTALTASPGPLPAIQFVSIEHG